MTLTIASLNPLLACSICFGTDGSTLDAANAAVIFMLLLLVGVLGSFLSFIFYLARRSRQVAMEDEANASFPDSADQVRDRSSALSH